MKPIQKWSPSLISKLEQEIENRSKIRKLREHYKVLKSAVVGSWVQDRMCYGREDYPDSDLDVVFFVDQEVLEGLLDQFLFNPKMRFEIEVRVQVQRLQRYRKAYNGFQIPLFDLQERKLYDFDEKEIDRFFHERADKRRELQCRQRQEVSRLVRRVCRKLLQEEGLI